MAATENHRVRRVIRLALGALFVSAPGTSSAFGQEDRREEKAVLEGFRALEHQVGGLDWEREFPHIERALQTIWAQNGWSDESDRYAYEVTREVAAIPPWEFAKRLDVLTKRIGERYLLSERDAARFKGHILREVGGLMMRNAGAVFSSAQEALSARARGEPYTPEQIARWMKSMEPMQADADRAAERLTRQLESMVGDEGRRTLERDLKSYEKRMKRYDEMAARWAEGDWRPSDWGMQNDPIQRKASIRDRNDRAGPAGPPRHTARTRWAAHDPSTWDAYVVYFKRRFKLDGGQSTTAESIHSELASRARDYIKAHEERLKAIPHRLRPEHADYEPVRALFRELQERLDALPTSAQRAQSKP
jgi:hypothetical protein